MTDSLFDSAPDSPEEDPYAMGTDDRAEADPFSAISSPRKAKAPSRERILQTNASALSIAAMAPVGFQSATPEAVPEKRHRAPAKAFSTEQGIAWRKSQGHEILATEEARAHKDKRGNWVRRRADHKMYADCISILGGVVYSSQFAGTGERESHYRDFLGELARIGEDRARALYPGGCWFAAFERGFSEPMSVERWL